MDIMGLPGSSVGKEPTCNAGDTGDLDSVPESGRIPWKRAWQPTPVFLPGESHGQRSLDSPWDRKDRLQSKGSQRQATVHGITKTGYSPRDRKESDAIEVTEHTCTHTHTHTG